jgi:hypothetical protein
MRPAIGGRPLADQAVSAPPGPRERARGPHFDDSSAYLFDRRLGERVLALDLTGFDEYYRYLRFNVRGKTELEE